MFNYRQTTNPKTMTNAAADYPLNCIDNLSDGFSGWFAISNTRQCNDFCYWHQEPIKNKTEEKDGADGNDNDAGSADEGEDEEADSGDDGDDGESQYTAWNTANPHQTTVIHADDSGDQKVSAYWVCVYDAADDTVLASQAQGQSWFESWHTYYSGGKNDMSMIPPLDGIQERFDNVPFPYLRCQKVRWWYIIFIYFF